MLKNFVKESGSGLDLENGEFTCYYILHKLIDHHGATCGGAAKDVFHPTCFFFCNVLLQLGGKHGLPSERDI